MVCLPVDRWKESGGGCRLKHAFYWQGVAAYHFDGSRIVETWKYPPDGSFHADEHESRTRLFLPSHCVLRIADSLSGPENGPVASRLDLVLATLPANTAL